MCIHCTYIGYIMKSYAYPKDAIFKKETLISTHIEHRTATRIVLILLQVSVKESGKKYQRGKRVDQNRWHKIPRWHLHITIMILKKEEGRPNVASMEILCCRCERRSIYQKDNCVSISTKSLSAGRKWSRPFNAHWHCPNQLKFSSGVLAESKSMAKT